MTYMVEGGVSIVGFAKCSTRRVTTALPFLSLLTSTSPIAEGSIFVEAKWYVFAQPARVANISMPRHTRTVGRDLFVRIFLSLGCFTE
jgi:hypothetical protein